MRRGASVVASAGVELSDTSTAGGARFIPRPYPLTSIDWGDRSRIAPTGSQRSEKGDARRLAYRAFSAASL